jgi:hypothetical protein
MNHEIIIPKQFIEASEHFRFIRLKTGEESPEQKKEPKDWGWTSGEGGRKHNDPALISWINTGHNYGFHAISGQICVFDCDDTLYDPALISLFANTFTVKTGRGYHFIFKSDLEFRSEKIILNTDTGIHIGHILLPGMNFQTVGPNCIHPSGDIYTVIRDLPFEWIPAETIMSHIKGYIIENETPEHTIPERTHNYSRSPLCEVLDLRVEDIGYPTGDIRQHGLEIQGVHPFHGSSRGNKGNNYSINPTKGLWHCFRCDSGGDALTLLAVKHGIITCGESKAGCLSDEHTLSRLLELLRHGVEGADIANKLIEYETKEREEYFKKKDESLAHVILDGIINRTVDIEPEGEPEEVIPKELLSIPGELQEVVNYYNATAIKPQPQLAVLSAIAIGSTVLGRRFFTNMDNGANMYLAAVAKSSSGKEHIKTVVERVLFEAELSEYIGPPGYTSAGAVSTWLYKKPNHISMIDEFGRMLQSTNKSGNSNQMDAITELMQIYGRQMGVHMPRGYSEISHIKKPRKRNEQTDEPVCMDVHNPSITLLGITTPSTLYESLTSGDILNGFLPRLVVVDSVYGRQVSKRRGAAQIPVPSRLVEWCKEHGRMIIGEGDLCSVNHPQLPPEPIIIQISDAAYLLFEAYELECKNHQDANEHTGLDVMWGRCRENAQRLSLIVAISCRSNVILGEHAAYAISFVKFYSERLIKEAGGSISDTNFEAVVKSVYKAIEKAGPKGVTRAEMSKRCRKYKGLNTRERDMVVQAIVDDYDVKPYKPPGQRGVQRYAYTLSKYIKEDE